MKCGFVYKHLYCSEKSLPDLKYCESHKYLIDGKLFASIYMGDYDLANKLINTGTNIFLDEKSKLLEHIIYAYLQKNLSVSQIEDFPKIIQLLINYNTPVLILNTWRNMLFLGLQVLIFKNVWIL